MPKMIYEHTDNIDKKLAVIKKQGYINDINVSNKSKVIDYAIETLAEIIIQHPEVINRVNNKK